MHRRRLTIIFWVTLGSQYLGKQPCLSHALKFSAATFATDCPSCHLTVSSSNRSNVPRPYRNIRLYFGTYKENKTRPSLAFSQLVFPCLSSLKHKKQEDHAYPVQARSPSPNQVCAPVVLGEFLKYMDTNLCPAAPCPMGTLCHSSRGSRLRLLSIMRAIIIAIKTILLKTIPLEMILTIGQ